MIKTSKYFHSLFIHEYKKETFHSNLTIKDIVKSGNKNEALFALTFSMGVLILDVVVMSQCVVDFLVSKKIGATTVFHMPFALACLFFFSRHAIKHSQAVLELKTAMEKKHVKDDI